MKKHIPNLLTLANLMCGVFAVITVLSGNVSYEIGAFLIFLGAVFDFLDGFVARLLKVTSVIGKELDSLADLVTFGFAPAAMLSAVMQHELFGELSYFEYTQTATLVWQEYLLVLSPFVIVPFSALRLAKFNVDTRQTHSFIGLPTPANALFFASLIFYPSLSPVFLAFLAVGFSLLLVAEIPMFSIKFKDFSFFNNKLRYIFLALSLVAVVLFQLLALPFIILFYIISSLILYLINREKVSDL